MNLSSFRQQGGSGLYMRERRFFFDCQETYTWTVPDGVTKVFAFVIGGGGGGGVRLSNTQNDTWGAQGGAGGGYAHGYVATTPGSTYTITVGKGGMGEQRGTSSQAGTASSFGSNLTGNGGAAGNEANYQDGGDGSTRWGQGGSASTSNVTEGYTAAGGGTPTGQNYAYTGYYGTGCATGGASSGSPFGRGSSRPPICPGAANGGSGWSTGSYKNQGALAYMAYAADTQMKTCSFGGDGSHHMNPWCAGSPDGETQYNNASRGGAGLQARGGAASCNRYDASSANNTVNGENGNPNWWFPWDIDGGGGGGAIVNISNNSNDQDNSARAGHGGPGAGGGGANAERSADQTGFHTCAGDGGFGGGGGGAASYWQYTNSQKGCGTRGGNGGIGGGGGAAAHSDKSWSTTPHTVFGGNGGKGIVAVYW